MLPAVTRVTLLPKHSQVIRNLSGELVALCYLRLPLLPCYPNTVTKIFNLN